MAMVFDDSSSPTWVSVSLIHFNNVEWSLFKCIEQSMKLGGGELGNVPVTSGSSDSVGGKPSGGGSGVLEGTGFSGRWLR